MRELAMFLGVTSFAFFTAGQARAEVFGGIDFPDGAASFADSVVTYSPGAGVVDPYRDPSRALGVPDGSGSNAVALGNGGLIILRFTDNSLTTSGNADHDLWIFEVGPQVENMQVSISTDGTNFISVGDVSGQPTGVDIDHYVSPGGVQLWERYSYVRIVDLPPNTSSSPYAGADITAVGAISSAPPIPIPATVWLFASVLGLGGLGWGRCRYS
jgi:hypothetical protein